MEMLAQMIERRERIDQLRREILRMRTMLEEMISRHSGQAIEKVRKDIDRDKILTAEEAKDYGLIDQVLSTRKKSALAAAPA